MINKFNAFISYKHADLDNKVAEAIIKGLERYHIPGKIRKATGFKKIDRIFRDKDELPITNDLNDTITEALGNSDYLIVICSTNTKKSMWVEKEIETFLKNHEMSHILTVLADGEPSEVIPKALLSQKKQVQDENGKYHMVEIPLEPLSCDYRLPKAKAKAEELPRLVAALIGCSYDELMNRRRQYMMRRMGAIFTGILALAVGFGLYMYRSNMLIQKNYLESLRNQSRYLANESEKQLDNENRMGAMQLALEALPKDENDERPVTPEAVRAVTDATLAYVSLQGSNVSAAWNYRMPNEIKRFEVSDNGAVLAAMDMTGAVEVWDTATHQQILFVEAAEDKAQSIMFVGNDKLIVDRDLSMEVYSLTDGRQLWQRKTGSNVITADGIHVYSDERLITVGHEGIAEIISLWDGSVKESYSIIPNIDEGNLTITDSVFSEETKRLCFMTKDSSGDVFYINEYDFETQSSVAQKLDVTWSGAMAYCNDNILVSFTEGQFGGSTMMYDYTFVTEDHLDVLCFESGTLNLKWDYDFTYTDVYMNSRFLPLGSDMVGLYAGNTARIWYADTGELIAEHKVNDPIIDISDNDKDGDPLYITRSGGTATAAMGGVAVFDRFMDNLTDVEVNGGFYTLEYLSNEIVYYGTKVFDENWTGLGDMPLYNPDSDVCYMNDDQLVILGKEEEGTKILAVDLGEKKYLGDAIISTELAPYKYRILGVYENVAYLATCNSKQFEIITYDIDTRAVSREVINEEYFTYDPVCALKEDKLVYYNPADFATGSLFVRNLSDGTETEYAFPYQKIIDMSFSYEANMLYLMGTEADVVLDLKDGDIAVVEAHEDWKGTQKAAVNTNGECIAATDLDNIRLISRDGNILKTISCDNVHPIGMDIHAMTDGKDILFVAYNNQTLVRYDAVTGEVIGRSNIATATSTFATADFNFDDEGQYLYITTSELLDVIETDSWIELAHIAYCYGYHKVSDTFWTVSFKEKRAESQIGYFSRYSVEDLTNKAKDLLGGIEMTDEQKAYYGIN